MRKFYSLLLAVVLFAGFGAAAQVTVTNPTNTTPGLAATYPTLAAAITDLNLQTAISGQVTITLTGNEAAPAGGYLVTAIPAGASATNNIIIEGSGSIITAFANQTAGNLNDAIFKIVGADYITIRNFTMQEDAGNNVTAAASNNMTEWGVALLYASTTNGAQNNTIQNNIISLNRVYVNTFGIYSNTQHSATLVTTSAVATNSAGANSNNKIYANQVSNVNYGIALIGSTTAGAFDTGNDVGGTGSPNGNTLLNWGGGAAPSGYIGLLTTLNAGIYAVQQINDNYSFNSLTSASLTGTLSVYGILKFATVAATGTIITTINNNTLTITNNPSVSTAGSIFPISSQAQSTYLATATITINNNTVQNCVLGGSTATTPGITAISNLALPGVLNMNNNTISNNVISATTSTTAQLICVSNSGAAGAVSMTGNSLINNTITSASATTALIGGILNSAAVTTLNMNNNSLRGFSSSAASGQMQGVLNSGNVVTTMNINGNQLGNTSGGFFSSAVNSSGSLFGVYTVGTSGTCTYTLQNNDFRGINYSGSAPTALQYLVYAAPTTNQPAGLNISGNTFTSLSLKTSGTIYLVYNSNFVNTFTVNNNSIVTSFARTLGGLTYGYYNFGSPSGGTATITNNNFSNVALTGASGFYGIRHYTSTSQIENINNNTISNVTGGSTSAIYGISHGYGAIGSTVNNNIINNLSGGSTVYGINLGDLTASLGLTCSGNTVNTLSSTGATAVYGIYHTAGANTVISKNKVYDLSSSNAGGSVNGIAVPAGTTVTVVNNLVGDLRTPAANAANPLIGLNITGGTTVNAYYNTVYVNGSSSGAVFGSSALSVANAVGFTSRNNIFVNNSTSNSTGLSVVYRRSTAATANYNAASNNNLFYAATGVVYFDGTTSYSTFPAYKTYIATRDQASISENPNFLSTVGSNPNFLHIDPTIATQIEGGAVAIAGFTDDFDGQTRPLAPATTPDIGADEFVGTTPAPVITLGTAPIGACTSSSHTVSVNVSVLAGTITSVILNVSGGQTASTAMTLTSGTTTNGVWTATIFGGTPGVAVNYSVTATSSTGLSTTYTGTPYTDAPLTGVTATATASANPICAGSPTILTAKLTRTLTASIGTSTSITTPTQELTAFCNRRLSYRMQMLFTAAELNAAGLSAGKFNSMTFTIGANGDATTNANFIVKAGPTALSALADYISTSSFTTVFPSATYTHAVGTNIINFSTPYVWDGSSNIVIEVSHSGADLSNNATTYYTTTPANTVAYGYNGATTGTLSTSRPNVTFVVDAAPTITSVSWSDGSTTSTGNPLTVNPLVTSTYTATITAAGCTIDAPPLSVTVNPLPAAPSDASIPNQCGAPTFTATSTAPSPTFTFYSAATGGTTLATNTTGTYTLSPFALGPNSVWVTVTSAGCTSSPRTQLTVNSSVAPSITLSQTGTVNTCVNRIETLTASSPMTYYSIYNWAPTANLFQDAAATIPYTGQNLSTVYYKRTSVTAGETITVTGSESPALCSNTASVTFVVSASPATVTATASVTSICAGNPVTLTATGAGTPTYCTPVFTLTDGTDYIAKVELLTSTGATTLFSRTSGSFGLPGYDDQSATSATTLTAGTTYTFRVTIGSAADNVAAFIDYDGDGAFTGTGETLLTSTAVASSGNTGLISFTIPAGAFNGTARIRFVEKFSSAAIPCVTSGYGEAEDYSVTIVGGVANPNLVTFSWKDETNAVVGSGTPLIISPTVTHTYTATATNAGGCTSVSNGVTVTINAPLAGIYSVGSGNIGGEAGHFATITAAVNAFNSACGAGSVTFALTDALYSTAETFPIVINANSASSSTNTLTIKPNTGVTAAITGTVASGALIVVKNNYTTIDGSNNGGTGRNLTITNNGATAPNVIAITSTGTGLVRNVALKNTVLIDGAQLNYALIVSDAATLGNAGNFNNITIQNNSIQKAFGGIYINGNTTTANGANLLVTANDLNVAGTNALLRGIYAGGINGSSSFTNNNFGNYSDAGAQSPFAIALGTGVDNCNISGNTIASISSTNTGAYSASGISIASLATAANISIHDNTISAISGAGTAVGNAATSGISVTGATPNVTIYNNKITNIKNTNTTGYGADGILLASTSATANTKVYNNFISDVSAYGFTNLNNRNGYGIIIYNGAGYSIDYNSVNLNTSQTLTGSSSAAMYIHGNVSTAGAVTLRNNIFNNTESVGTNYALQSTSANTIFGTVNYNDYYTTGAPLASINATAAADLTALQAATGQDANSKNVPPVFVSATDLHLIPSSNIALDDQGTPTPVGGITTDIDGDTRPAGTATDIGADEFTVPIGLDFGVSALTAPPVKTCYTNAEQVTVSIRNYSVATHDFSVYPVTVTVNITGAITQTLITTISTGTLASNGVLSVPVGTIDMTVATGNYVFNAFTTIGGGGTDVTTSNDALTPAVTRTVVPVTAGTASASTTSYCVTGGTPTLTLTGYAGGSIQWEESTVSATGPFTPVAGATSATYTPASAITATTYYRAVVSCATTAISNVVTVSLNNPIVTDFSGNGGALPAASRCGPGTVTLQATGNAGSTLNWYAAASGGTPLATGTSFTTPSISSTTTYYVAAASGSGMGNVGRTAVPPAAGYNTASAYLIFDALANFNLSTVVIYPYSASTTAGTVVIALQNSAGVTLQQTSPIAVTGTAAAIPLTVNLNFNITPGTNYRLTYLSSTGITGLLRETTGIPFPYTYPGIVSITNGSLAGYYYYFYNWTISVPCESARTAVTATISTPPVLTLSTNTASICAGSTSSLVTLTSTLADYDTYTFTPSTGVSGNATSGWTFNPTVTTTYTLNAAQTSGSLCSNTASVTVTVNPLPSAVTIAPTAATICAGSIQQLTASGGLATGNIFTEPANTLPTTFSVVNAAGTGTATLNTTYYAEGTGSVLFNTASTGADVQYSMNSNLDLTGAASAQLTFSHIAAMEGTTYSYDLGYVEYSTNGGTSWTTFPNSSYAGSGTLITTQALANPVTGVIFSNKSYTDWNSTFTSASSTPGAGPATSLFKNEIVNVPASALTSNQFRVRFRYTTDGSTNYYGWLIDNIKVSKTSGSITWSPTGGLYTDAAATNAYTGGITNTVYAKPATTATYVATATATGPCYNSASATVTVTPQPNATIAYTGGPFCAAGSAIPTVGGTVGTTGGIYSSTTGLNFVSTSTGEIDLTASTAGTYTVTYTVAAAGGCAVYTTTGSVVIRANGVWAGVDNNWFNSANWCGGIPTATSNVTIPAGAPNYPIISFGTALANNINIASGASVIVNGTGVFSLSGAITNTGTFNLTAGTLNLAGTNMTLSGTSFLNATVYNLTMSSSSTATITTGAANLLNVLNNMSFNSSNNTFATNGNLTLMSTVVNTASVTDMTNNGTVSGNTITGSVSVQRYIPAQRKWRFLAVNTTGGPLTVQNSWMESQTPGTPGPAGFGLWVTDPSGTGFDAVSPNATIKWWNTAVNDYTVITNPTTYDLRSHSAYMTFVRGDRYATGANNPTSFETVLRTKGTLFQGSQPTINIPVVAGQYTSIGNPYPSAIDLKKLNWNSSTDPVTIAVWDPKLASGYGYGAFQYLSAATPTGNYTIMPGGGSYGPGGSTVNSIESGQAFFIQSAVGARNINFVEVAKTPSANDVFFAPQNEQKILGLLSVQEADNSMVVVDGTLVRFKANNNTGIDNNDARKLGNTQESISVKHNNNLLAIEYRNVPDESDTIQYNMSGMRYRNYTWKFDLNNMDAPGRIAYLVDRFMNTKTQLDPMGATAYNFAITTTAGSWAPNRFYIVFKNVPGFRIPIAANRQPNGDVAVKWSGVNELNVAHYELERSNSKTSGFVSIGANTSPTNNVGETAQYAQTDSRPLITMAWYRVKAVLTDGSFIYSETVSIDAPVKEGTLAVRPNPVAGKVIHLYTGDLEAGNYQSQVISSTGQVIYKGTITLGAGQNHKEIPLNKATTHGEYTLVIVSEKGVKKAIRIMILE